MVYGIQIERISLLLCLSASAVSVVDSVPQLSETVLDYCMHAIAEG
jgi:hypothetical protein